MQDWPLEVSHQINVEDALVVYDNASEDEKFVIMQGLLYVLDDVVEKADFDKLSIQIERLLEKDFSVHEYTIYYWTLYGTPWMEGKFNVTPLCREVWKKKKTTAYNKS